MKKTIISWKVKVETLFIYLTFKCQDKVYIDINH